MGDVSIRLFNEDDVEFAYESTLMEKWNNTREDVQRMFRYNPSGCFIVEVNGKRVGHVFSFKYGKLGWIGLLIVRAEHRRKGIGTLLMKRAMKHLFGRGVETIRLEAVSALANFYRKLGFVDEYESLRFSGLNQKPVSKFHSKVKLMEKNLVKEVAEFDAKYFGANRINVLKSLHDDYPQFCFISGVSSEIDGYLMCRRAEGGYRIGPWVCNPQNPQTAKELLIKCMETIRQKEKIYVGVPAVNKVAVEVLEEFGFEQYSKSIRMRLGKKMENERVDGVFAIGSPEKG
ncbi:MAG: GNAT family N-acetyltransferase [Candidatus Bathyarchaeia archaeon]